MCNINDKISDLSNIGIKLQIDVLVKFNDLRNKVFGVELHEDQEDSLHNLISPSNKIPNISKLPKMHILACHVKQFLQKFGKGKGLGFYSEQTGETVHEKFKNGYRRNE